MILHSLIMLLALQTTPAPTPAVQPSVSATCNTPPEVVRLAPIYVSPTVASTFPGVRKAVVAVTVDDQGQVIDASIITSNLEPFLNPAAIDVAKHSVYAPGAANCKPTGGTLNVSIVFQPRDYSC